jgi:hypothetical protein
VVILQEAAQTLSADDAVVASRLNASREDQHVAQALMIALMVIEVDNPTHILLSGGTSVIRGIPGSAVRSPCTRCSSSVGSPCVGAVSKRNELVGA